MLEDFEWHFAKPRAFVRLEVVLKRFGEFLLCNVVGGWVGKWGEAVRWYRFIIERFLVIIAKRF